jgi:long-chain-fatty-acid--[acyl-carrier-protein] ligase
MIDFVVCAIAKGLLWLRYCIRIKGLDAVMAKGREKILFLPNHPALIDPVILYAYLRGLFSPRGFADSDQVNRFLIRYFAKRWGVRSARSMAKYGLVVRDEVEKVLDESIEGLKRGENLLLWPAGRIYRSFKESLGAKSSVERILQQCPDVRVVLIRTRGLWGSRFGFASGKEPNVAKVLAKGALSLLASGIFFAPRREVTIEFFEPEDLPRGADRNTFNRYLEAYYNADALPNTYVPYTIWERGGPVVMPEPVSARKEEYAIQAPETTRKIVLDYLSELTGVRELKDSDTLAGDLGMDSLDGADLVLWLEKEFGFAQAQADAIKTVGDVMLAACGEFVYSGPAELKPPSPAWFGDIGRERLRVAKGETVTEAFLNRAEKSPSQIVIADQAGGTKSYRDIVTACIVLKRVIRKFGGEYVGIMMPASAAADILYLSVLFAQKTPVMVNWTAGVRNISAWLDKLGVRHVLTSKAVVERIKSMGTDLSSIEGRFVYVEDLAGGVGQLGKLVGWMQGHLSWAGLRRAKVSGTAAVLFTSGSETLPKAVPLTHDNLLTNLRDVLGVIRVYEDDRLIGFLPPFHSFGLTVTVLLPLLSGAKTVYHPNPVEGGTMAQLIDAYRATVLIGTPTFVNGIIRMGTEKQLSVLRLVVTGAERCPEKVYEGFKKKCSGAVMLEGYGVTECSPIISLNDENDPRPFTIGKVLPSLKYMLVDAETGKPLSGPGTGILLVRGPSVFEGYLRPAAADKYEGKPPFVEIDDKSWYSTGDLVTEDKDGVLTFNGRLKRFVKLGGEMVSLPAIEAVLEEHYAHETDEKPVIAVEATSDEEHPELVLFTVRQIDREDANRHIRKAGLSGLHSIRKVVKLDEIPLLGTGKTDYRALKARLAKEVP